MQKLYLFLFLLKMMTSHFCAVHVCRTWHDCHRLSYYISIIYFYIGKCKQGPNIRGRAPRDVRGHICDSHVQGDASGQGGVQERQRYRENCEVCPSPTGQEGERTVKKKGAGADKRPCHQSTSKFINNVWRICYSSVCFFYRMGS